MVGIIVVDGQRSSFKIARGTPRAIIKARAIAGGDSNNGQYFAGNEGRYVRSGNEGQYVGRQDDRYDHIVAKASQEKKEYVGRAKLQKTASYRFGKTAFKQTFVTTTPPPTLPPATEPPKPLPRLITTQPRFITAQPRLITAQPRLVTAQPFKLPITTKKISHVNPQNGQEWLIIRHKNEVNQDGYHSL